MTRFLENERYEAEIQKVEISPTGFAAPNGFSPANNG
jgi:hypothetical protein